MREQFLQRSNQTKNGVLQPYLGRVWGCVIFIFKPWESSKSFTWLCGVWFIFRRTATFSTATMSQTYHYFHDKCSHEPHSLISPAYTFAAKTHFAINKLNHTPSQCIPLVRKMFHTEIFFPRAYYFIERTVAWLLNRTL